MITLKKIPKSFFFDRKAVIDRVGIAKVKVLSKVGAFLRKRAQTSMRYRKKASPPGTPPSAHKETGALIRKLLFFSYDPASDSVVVGPVAAGRAEAPNLQEFGGTVRTAGTRRVPIGEAGRDMRGRFVSRKTVIVPAGTSLTYPARPFMLPALIASEPKLPAEWAGAVRQ